MKKPASMALKLARKVFADGGDVYQSEGGKLVENGKVNWGNPDLAADFFRADAAQRALDLARSEGATPRTKGSDATSSVTSDTTAPSSAASTPRDVYGMPALKGVDPYQAALLNALAAPESSGAYNIRYTPGGGATFEGYGQHPRIYEPTSTGQKSSAAGRYQFTYSTWSSLPEEYRKDFTPETQDKAALYYAQGVYETTTGGDLYKDLRKYGFTPKIVEALGSVWHGVADNPKKAALAYNQTLNRLSGSTPRKAGGAVKSRKGFDEGGEAAGSVEKQENATPVQVAQLDQTAQQAQQVQQTADQGPQWKTWFGYTPTQSDYDKMLRVALGEAGVNSYDQYRGVYEATGNRLASGAYGKSTLSDLITPKQMAGITQTDVINDLMTSNDPTKQKAYQTAQQALNDYLTEGQNKVLTTQTDWRGFQNGKPSPGTGFENATVPGGTDTKYQYNKFYDAYDNPDVADKLAGLLAEKNGIYTYNPYTKDYAQDVLSKENQLAAAENTGVTGIQQAGLNTTNDFQAQQDAINAAQQAAVNQAQNFDTGIVQNAATDFNYLNPLQNTGVGDFTNMYTNVDYSNPVQNTYTPSLTDYSYNAFDTSSPWSFKRGGRIKKALNVAGKYMTGGNVPTVPEKRKSWADRTNEILQKQTMTPEQEDETSEKLESLQNKQNRNMFASGGKVGQYPLRDHDKWTKHQKYKNSNGKLVHMSPDEFLERTQSVDMNGDAKKTIKKFKRKMEKGKHLNPLAIFPAGGQDGRHRAHAAKALGIKKVPVIVWPEKKGSGSSVNSAAKSSSKKA